MKNGQFFKVNNITCQAITTLNIPGREKDILNFVLRLTDGCRSQEWAQIRLVDFYAIGIDSQHIKKLIINLVNRGFLLWNKDKNEFKVDEICLQNEYRGTIPLKIQERMDWLIHINLKHTGYQNGNPNVTEVVTKELPRMEETTYHNGKTKSDLTAQKQAPEHIKDILKNRKYSNKDRKDIADKNKNLSINPLKFVPSAEGESATLHAWKTLEPNNLESFNTTYLNAYKKGVPANIIRLFTSEIIQDSTIEKKGAVFNNKVKSYLNNKRKKI